MVSFNKQNITKEIRNRTYTYLKDLDLYFRDYVYGDKYYITLEDVIYMYMTSNNLDWDFDLSGNIEIDQLVTDLYCHYMKADRKFLKNYAGRDKRYRKNYIMKALLNATRPLLKKQLKEHSILVQELDEINKIRKLHYVSLYAQEGRLLEDISYKHWKDEISENCDTAIKREQLARIFKILNPLEKKVISLIIKNKSYREISRILHVKQDKVRKISYFAKQKLIEEYSCKGDRNYTL